MNIQTPSVSTQVKKVAIQGMKGSFHEIAAQKFFGREVPIAMCESFLSLFQTLEQGKADYAVMAIENSVAGSILPNYALLRESEYRIIGDIFLRIEHQLMCLPGQSLADIKEVHSHPMALQQCHNFFRKYPHMRLVESFDTAGSAQWIKEEKLQGVAAVASDLAAKYFDLEILASGIETNKRNFTRFLILHEQNAARSIVLYPNKASVCFNMGGRSEHVGSLSQVLLVLSSHGMNLTKIQSLPLLGKEWEYFFHIDLEFESYAQYQRSLDAIRPIVSELKILGEYPRGSKAV